MLDELLPAVEASLDRHVGQLREPISPDVIRVGHGHDASAALERQSRVQRSAIAGTDDRERDVSSHYRRASRASAGPGTEAIVVRSGTGGQSGTTTKALRAGLGV
jgi:hypothetical protein